MGLDCGGCSAILSYMTSTRESQAPIRVSFCLRITVSLGVEALLHDRTELEVVCHQDVDKVLERVRTFRPYAVVLVLQFGRLHELASEWQRILSDVPDIRLIPLSLQDNTVHIHQDGQTNAPGRGRVTERLPEHRSQREGARQEQFLERRYYL